MVVLDQLQCSAPNACSPPTLMISSRKLWSKPSFMAFCSGHTQIACNEERVEVVCCFLNFPLPHLHHIIYVFLVLLSNLSHLQYQDGCAVACTMSRRRQNKLTSGASSVPYCAAHSNSLKACPLLINTQEGRGRDPLRTRGPRSCSSWFGRVTMERTQQVQLERVQHNPATYTPRSRCSRPA